MTIPYLCILIAALLPYLWVAISKASGQRYNNRDPRGWLAKQDNPRAHRANSAQTPVPKAPTRAMTKVPAMRAPATPPHNQTALAAPASTVIALDDAWRDIASPEGDGISFKRPILGAAKQDPLSPRHVTFRMEDSSIGGMLSRLTRNNICAELRAALHKDSPSQAAILRTMQERGCSI